MLRSALSQTGEPGPERRKERNADSLCFTADFCRESKLVANLGNIPLILAEAPLGAKGKHLPQKPLVLLRALVLM